MTGTNNTNRLSLYEKFGNLSLGFGCYNYCNTFIPSPTPVVSPSVAIINQNQKTNPNTLGKKLYPNPPSPMPKSEIEGKKAVIETEKGQIIIELSKDTPLASSNFIFLAKEKFYDGLTFHRREEGFVIQGGDPAGNGTGGPGYAFADEPVLEITCGGLLQWPTPVQIPTAANSLLCSKTTPNFPKITQYSER